MLLFYRRRGIVEIVKVELQGNELCRSLLPMPLPYTCVVPAANADINSKTVSFELSSPVTPPHVATISLDSGRCLSLVAAQSCHSSVSQDDFDVRLVSLTERPYACEM